MKTHIMRFTCLALAVACVATANVEASQEQIQRELDRVNDIYRAITSYHMLLDGDDVSKDTVTAALYDVERYVEELDNRLATDKLFISDKGAIDEIAEVVAKAHMQAALLHARGVDLEGSISQYEKVIELLGYEPTRWDEQIERSGYQGLMAGASEVVFEMAKPETIVRDLKQFWSAGVITRFNVAEYTPGQRAGITMERIGGGRTAFSEAAYQLAAERLIERLATGEESFRVVLPAGRYEISSPDESVMGRQFVVKRGGSPDPVVLNPNTFSFAFASEGECRPQLTLNGIAVRDYQNIPYGTYRVIAAPNCGQRLPDKITVEQKEEVTLRTEPERLDFVKEGQPIFLFITTPPGSTYKLRM